MLFFIFLRMETQQTISSMSEKEKEALGLNSEAQVRRTSLRHEMDYFHRDIHAVFFY